MGKEANPVLSARGEESENGTGSGGKLHVLDDIWVMMMMYPLVHDTGLDKAATGGLTRLSVL